MSKVTKYPKQDEQEKKDIVMKILQAQGKDPFIDSDTGDIFYHENENESKDSV